MPLPGFSESYFATGGGVWVRGCQAPDPRPRAYVRGGFCRSFALKQRCLPGWLHTGCMQAQRKSSLGAVIAGVDEAKREHESARHRLPLQSKKSM